MESQNNTLRPSREEQRKERRLKERSASRERAKKPTNDNEKVRIRIIPIWLRILLVIAGCLFAVLLGLTIGYAIIGEGSFGEIFKISTWTHMIDLVLKE